ncbi:hypothetical protein TCAL_09401 [Tigriopus californicus]|uniref:Magnesium transporter NIPA2 n=1 Tax=Tigriopus californicus TaxID=6832 RepID=A0A553NVQ5_TIGCA|nr:magnesium transporter NIPA2-like [Tigriopus californicus]TRY69508.1 hypothetical protein TCAL_09401 [Tigriopus californicus]
MEVNTVGVPEYRTLWNGSRNDPLENCSCPNPWEQANRVEPGVLNLDLQFVIGLSLAIGASLLIGTSFVVKKKSSICREQSDLGVSVEDGGGTGNLCDWLWWLGIFLMTVGELANFAAYAFIPATVVAPLGALSVLVTACLASVFLGERLNLVGIFSCFLCLLGSTIVVLHTPKETGVVSMNQLGELLAQPAFVVYLLLMIIGSIILIFFFGPRYGKSNVLVFVLTSSFIGSLSVMAVKGLALAVWATSQGRNEFNNGITYIFIATMLVCIAVQMIYLNRALDVFFISSVSSLYYVLFSTWVMVGAGILYQEYAELSWYDILGSSIGFIVNVIAVLMLQLFKEFGEGFKEIQFFFGPQVKLNWPIIAEKPSRSSEPTPITPLNSRHESVSSARHSDAMDGQYVNADDKIHLLEHAASIAGSERPDQRAASYSGSYQNTSLQTSRDTLSTDLDDEEENTIVVHLGEDSEDTDFPPRDSTKDGLISQGLESNANHYDVNTKLTGVNSHYSSPKTSNFASPRSTIYGSVTSLRN